MSVRVCKQLLPNGSRCKNPTSRGHAYCWLPEHDGRSPSQAPAQTNSASSLAAASLRNVDLTQESTHSTVDASLNAISDALSDSRPPDERGYIRHPDNPHLHEMQLRVHACADLLRRLAVADSVWWDMHLSLSDDVDEFVRVKASVQESMWAAVRDAGMLHEDAKTPFEPVHAAMHECIMDLGAEARRCDSRLRDMSAAALHAGDPDGDPVFIDARKRHQAAKRRLGQVRQELDEAIAEKATVDLQMAEAREALEHARSGGSSDASVPSVSAAEDAHYAACIAYRLINAKRYKIASRRDRAWRDANALEGCIDHLVSDRGRSFNGRAEALSEYRRMGGTPDEMLAPGCVQKGTAQEFIVRAALRMFPSSWARKWQTNGRQTLRVTRAARQHRAHVAEVCSWSAGEKDEKIACKVYGDSLSTAAHELTHVYQRRSPDEYTVAEAMMAKSCFGGSDERLSKLPYDPDGGWEDHLGSRYAGRCYGGPIGYTFDEVYHPSIMAGTAYPKTATHELAAFGAEHLATDRPFGLDSPVEKVADWYTGVVLSV